MVEIVVMAVGGGDRGLFSYIIYFLENKGIYYFHILFIF